MGWLVGWPVERGLDWPARWHSACWAGLPFVLVGGLAGFLTVGLTIVSSGAWLSYLLAVCCLAASDKLPLRLMDFLDDAYRLGLLRPVGPSYQFRHAEFQDHLIRTADTQAAMHQPHQHHGH